MSNQPYIRHHCGKPFTKGTLDVNVLTYLDQLKGAPTVVYMDRFILVDYVVVIIASATCCNRHNKYFCSRGVE